MQLGMSEDDWMFDEYLPVGWFKKLYATKWHYCSSQFQIFTNTEEVLRYFLEVGMENDVVKKFSNLVEVPDDLLTPPPAPEPTPVTPKKKKKKTKKKEVDKSPSKTTKEKKRWSPKIPITKRNMTFLTVRPCLTQTLSSPRRTTWT